MWKREGTQRKPLQEAVSGFLNFCFGLFFLLNKIPMYFSTLFIMYITAPYTPKFSEQYIAKFVYIEFF